MTEEAGLRATSVKTDLHCLCRLAAQPLTSLPGEVEVHCWVASRVRKRGQKTKVITEREEKEKQLISRKARGSRDFIKG